MSSLFSSLSQLMPSQNSQILPDNLLQSPRVSIRAYGTTVTRPSANFFSSVQLHSATVRKNDRITDPTWFQDVRHIELDLKSPVDFSPGDISVIYPRAEESAVNSFLQVIGWEDVSEQIIQIGVSEDNPWPSSNPLPLSASLRDLLSKHLDFNAVPRRSFFELIRHFASDETEAEKLEEFSSPEGQEELYDYCQKVRRTIQEVLAEFKSVSVPVKYIFDLLPPLRPRQFSIANSVKLHPKQVHLCIAVVTYRTRLRRQRKGICSNYLASLSPGDTLDFSIIPGSLKLPSNPETPIVCIGPGTGVAPMRAVLQHRIQEGAPNNILYFGCRSAHMDQHYHTEWEGHHRDGCLEYRVACSRDGPPGTRRTYVQDLITHDNTRLGNILTNSMAYVYISGSSNQMPRDVKQALQSAVASVRDGGLGKETDIIRELEAEGRLFEECWS